MLIIKTMIAFDMVHLGIEKMIFCIHRDLRKRSWEPFRLEINIARLCRYESHDSYISEKYNFQDINHDILQLMSDAVMICLP